MFGHKNKTKFTLGAVMELGEGRIYYRLNAGMNFELLPRLHQELLEIAHRYPPRELNLTYEMALISTGVAIFPGDLIRDVSRHIQCAAASRKRCPPQPRVPDIIGAIPPIQQR